MNIADKVGGFCLADDSIEVLIFDIQLGQDELLDCHICINHKGWEGKPELKQKSEDVTDLEDVALYIKFL